MFERASDIPIGSLASESLNLSRHYNNPFQMTYHEEIYMSLIKIIELNVHALTYNAIFGQLSGVPSVVSLHPWH